MKVNAAFIAPLKSLKFDKIIVSLHTNSTVRDLLNQLEETYGYVIREIVFNSNGEPFVYIWVNDQKADLNTVLTDEDEIIFVPPIGGG